jgi:histidinol-phosphatase (PHP family)
MIADRHLHTRFSTDSKEDPEKSVKKALNLGMRDIYITDHYDIDFPEGAFMFDPDGYFEELSKLKEKYADRINVHIGVEVGIGEEISGKLYDFLNKYPWEYSIGSMHLIGDKDPYLRDLFDMDDEAYYRLFFETTLRSLKACGGFDTLGHLDYAVRYGYTKDKEYRYEKYADIIDEIFKEIISRNIALEINTAALRKGLKYVHPYPEALARYKELGGKKLAIGSDAHEADDVGYMFDETLKYIQQFGFSEADFM